MAQMEIKKIERSFKYEGYCFITAKGINGKEYTYKRKVYERKTGPMAGRCYVNLNTDVYSFVWNPIVKDLGQDFKYIGSYKKIEEAIKIEAGI